jgi:hypothetical protein
VQKKKIFLNLNIYFSSDSASPRTLLTEMAAFLTPGNSSLVVCLLCKTHKRNQLTPRSRVLPEKLSVPQLFNRNIRILWNPKIHYRIHKSRYLSLPKSDRSSSCAKPTSLELHFGISLPTTPRSSNWSLSLKHLHQNPVYALPLLHTCHMPRPSYSSWSDISKNIRRWQIIKLLIMQSSPIPCHLVPLRTKYAISTLFNNILNPSSSLNARHQVSRAYETTNKIIYLT